MKKFIKEFTAFIKRGSVLDLAIGIVIGGAFQKIVSSLVSDIIMPFLSIIGGVNISNAKWVMKAAVVDAEGNVIKSEIALLYGAFIQTIIDFLIIAFTIFIVIKFLTRFSKGIEKAKTSIGNIVDKLNDDKNETKVTEIKIEKKE